MNNTNILELFKNFNSHTDDYLGAMYISIYNQLPQCYRIYYDNKGDLQYIHSLESFYDIRKNQKIKIDCRELIKKAYNNKEKYGLNILY